jgi:hypothetical protein
MIKTLFDWLDRYPQSYWLMALGPTLWLAARIIILVREESRPTESVRPTVGWGDGALLFLFLLAWRWPFLLIAHDFNPDESQFIAGAITLTHDPVFWRSVDGMTSGPLNFYALLPLHALGFPLDYFSARLTGLLLIWGALFLCLKTLAWSFGRAVAWLGVLPALALFATATHADLVHYSSERVALLLVAMSCWLLACRQPGDRGRLWMACFVAGSAPWAKLQAIPLVLVLVAWACWQVWPGSGGKTGSGFRRLAGVGFAAVAPTLLVAVLLIATGQAETAFERYFLHNIFYIARGNNRTMWETLLEIKGTAMLDGRFPILFVTALGVVLAATFFFILRKVRPPVLFKLGAALTVAAVIAIAIPRREFLHYLLLLPVPLTLWLGAAAGAWWERLAAPRTRGLLAYGLLLAGGLLPLATRFLQPLPPICGALGHHWRYPRSNVAMVLHALAGRDDSLGVWGWATNLYVETGLPQATRDALSAWSILPGELRDYHRKIYLEDLRQNQPALFVDAVGPGAYAFESRQLHSHENFPELADYIGHHYVLVRDVIEARIYARKDLPALAGLSALKIDLLLARGRPNDRPKAAPLHSASLEKLPRKNIGPHSVTMLLPPVSVDWQLDQEVREVSLQFGFDPEAYERGASNGAEIVVELINAEQHRQVYRRLLDPGHQPRDRGVQSARITLPPFSANTRLVLRTEPGPFGDNAWDWVYLADVQFRRSPTFLPEQFPGYNRVPDTAVADYSGLLQNDRDTQLLLHAPASMNFKLNGGEQRLSFAYGFLPGAYTGTGHTDGAVFRVELQHPGQPVHVLFERYLNPVPRDGDRGQQELDLALPAKLSGGCLVVGIDPGPALSATWDWTYIRQFTLQ